MRRLFSATSSRLRKHPVLASLAVAAVAIGSGLGGGYAYAYYTSTGSGTGSASAGTLGPVTVETATVSPTTVLVPGNTGDAVLDIDNTNSYAVILVSVTGHGAITPDAGHSSCTTTGVTFTDQSGLSKNLPGNTTTVVDLTAAVSMSTASLSSCQGATFSIPVTITVHK